MTAIKYFVNTVNAVLKINVPYLKLLITNRLKEA
jgi:hypothetical protein